VPTIYHRAPYEMVGTLRFARPTACELICVARKRNLVRRMRPTGTTGKSLLIFRNRVKPGIEKYSAFASTQISPITPPVSPD
jgi:hypothetical protein